MGKDRLISDAFSIENIPTTRFYGSKRKMLPWLYQVFSKYDFDSVLDGFGGTGSVSLLLGTMGKKVTYNDAFLFNVVCTKAVFSNYTPSLLVQIAKDIKKVKPFKGPISTIYSDIFFTKKESNWLDGCMVFINSIDCPITRNIFCYALIQACLKKRPYNLFHRANLNLRLGNVERTFGNLSSWNEHFSVHIKTALSELEAFSYGTYSSPEILMPNDVLNLDNGFDLVYFDPPYVRKANNTDDYNRRYHFLEYLLKSGGLAGGTFSDSTIKEYLSNTFVKEWNNKNKIKDLLFSLIQKHRDSIVCLSYADDGVPSLNELKRFFKQNFKKTDINYLETKYALSGKVRQEIVITGLP